MTDALLALPFGLAIGLLLGLLGGGGSILAVPALVYVLGEPVKRATTESLLIVSITALVGMLAATRTDRVRWRLGLVFGAAAAPAAIGGTALNRLVGDRLLLLGFGLLLLVAAFAVVRGRAEVAAEHDPVWARVLVAGAGTGLLTGFFGVGGGFVIVPALTVALGLSLPVAIGTSLLVIAMTSSVALAAHLASGGIDGSLTAAFTGAAIVGAAAGTKLQARVPERGLRRLFAVLLVAVALVLIAKNAV